MTAIKAQSVRSKTMTEGSLRVEFDIPREMSQAAFALFGEPGVEVAIARLVTPAPKKPPEDKPKGGNAAQWLGQMCQDESFQQWLFGEFQDTLLLYDNETDDGDEIAARMVRHICGVKSRADINDTNPEAVKKFHALRVLWNQSRKA